MRLVSMRALASAAASDRTSARKAATAATCIDAGAIRSSSDSILGLVVRRRLLSTTSAFMSCLLIASSIPPQGRLATRSSTARAVATAKRPPAGSIRTGKATDLSAELEIMSRSSVRGWPCPEEAQSVGRLQCTCRADLHVRDWPTCRKTRPSRRFHAAGLRNRSK
jgi:hypothetical protein